MFIFSFNKLFDVRFLCRRMVNKFVFLTNALYTTFFMPVIFSSHSGHSVLYKNASLDLLARYIQIRNNFVECCRSLVNNDITFKLAQYVLLGVKPLHFLKSFFNIIKILFLIKKFQNMIFIIYILGGSVLGTRCSETYVEKYGKISLFGVPFWTYSNSPRTAIQVYLKVIYFI